MPAKIAHAMVVVAMLLMAAAVVSLKMRAPFLWFTARHLGGGSGLLLLLSIALHQCTGPCPASKG